MSAVRQNFLINVNLERLILLRNDQKTFVQTQGLPATGDLACAPCFQQHSISQFFLAHPVEASFALQFVVCGDLPPTSTSCDDCPTLTLMIRTCFATFLCKSCTCV